MDLAHWKSALSMHRSGEGSLDFLDVRQFALIGFEMHENTTARGCKHNIWKCLPVSLGLPGPLQVGAGQ